jgi:hypothetical protein
LQAQGFIIYLPANSTEALVLQALDKFVLKNHLSPVEYQQLFGADLLIPNEEICEDIGWLFTI